MAKCCIQLMITALLIALEIQAALTMPTGHNIEKRSTDRLGDLTATQAGILSAETDVPPPNCKAYLDAGYDKSGLYILNIGKGDFKAFCDMTLSGGGWTVIQRRIDNTTDFDRTWNEYKGGFGSFEKNMWIGLETLTEITNFQTYELYVGLENFAGDHAYQIYDSFKVKDEASNYELVLGADTIGPLETDSAGDSLADHHAQKFSTKDKDNDGNGALDCAGTYESGWWYQSDCHDAHLNGVYFHEDTNDPKGIIWQDFANTCSLKTAVMLIRPT